MEDFKPLESLIVETGEEEKLNSAHGKSRFLGLMFLYDDYQYIYRYSDDFNFEEGGEVILFGKRIVENSHDTQFRLSDEEFHIIEVIKTDEGLFFCTLLQLFSGSVSSFVSKDLQNVAWGKYKMYISIKSYFDAKMIRNQS